MYWLILGTDAIFDFLIPRLQHRESKWDFSTSATIFIASLKNHPLYLLKYIYFSMKTRLYLEQNCISTLLIITFHIFQSTFPFSFFFFWQSSSASVASRLQKPLPADRLVLTTKIIASWPYRFFYFKHNQSQTHSPAET